MLIKVRKETFLRFPEQSIEVYDILVRGSLGRKARYSYELLDFL